MARTRRLIRDNLSLVSLVIEVADARAPRATRHPNLASLVPGRPILTVLGKADLADPSATRAWVAHLRDSGRPEDSATPFSSEEARDAREIAKLALAIGRKRAGMSSQRAMVVGLPNVGKSTLINRLVGRASARTGDRPGITRGKQWIVALEGLGLLDLPGILVPGRLADRIALTLALLGILPAQAFDAITVAEHALAVLAEHGRLPAELTGEGTADDALIRYARGRGHLLSGGVPDLERAAVALVGAFREGRFGRLTLERPGAGPA
jgi:ribosome biogenesis GTPase A